MSSELTFFGRERRNNSLRKSDYHRRQIIITMIESDSFLSVRAISNESGVNYSVTYEMIEKFVKSGLVTPKLVAQHKARRDSKYQLTKDGKMIALAICFDEKRVLGKNHVELQNVFQPERGTDSLSFFVNTVMLNAINRGLENYVLRFLRNTIQFMESLSEPVNPLRIAQKAAGEASPSEIDTLRNCIIQALYGLSESEKDTIIQFYKTMITQTIFGLAMQSHNSKLERLATMSSKNPDGIFIPFQCKCDYVNDELYVKMEDVILKIFAGGWQCPSCGKIVSDSQIDLKNIGEQRLQLHA